MNGDRQLTARAFEIADQSMTELLRAHALGCDEFGRTWRLVDADGADVATLEEADPALIESVEWLRERGLCEIVNGPDGDVVLLAESMESE